MLARMLPFTPVMRNCVNEMGLLSNGSIDEEGQMNKSVKKSPKITADSLWLLRTVNDNDATYQNW